MPDQSPKETPRDGLPVGRAAFLATILAGIGGIALAPKISGTINGAVDSLPEGIGALVPGGGWRIYSVEAPLPTFHPATFQLKVHGFVERPVTLSWSKVAALPGATQISTFHCVTGWTVDNVHWEGIRGSTIADLVKPTKAATHVTFQSLETPYVDQLTRAQFELPDTMLARHMNGKPVSRQHGAPLKLVVPQMYGYKGVKWVTEIRYDSVEEPGYWEQRGYDTDAWVGRSNGL
ncbi:MAG TPA: molybdopterin-dependent oxidoreductase [Gaiellales bacterium]|jgi:DMSO/TMAO reductase YedYZ molybdopterin-dependent catalytic subunit